MVINKVQISQIKKYYGAIPDHDAAPLRKPQNNEIKNTKHPGNQPTATVEPPSPLYSRAQLEALLPVSASDDSSDAWESYGSHTPVTTGPRRSRRLGTREVKAMGREQDGDTDGEVSEVIDDDSEEVANPPPTPPVQSDQLSLSVGDTLLEFKRFLDGRDGGERGWGITLEDMATFLDSREASQPPVFNLPGDPPAVPVEPAARDHNRAVFTEAAQPETPHQLLEIGKPQTQ